MCIALISTAHPSYSLILINNRDEYLRRPTAPASYWPSPNTHILGGRDLARKSQGTWMGITTSGKIAVLTNYRESTSDAATGQQSRGAIVNSWLTRPETEHRSNRDETMQYVGEMVASPTARNVGGFSLVCGYVGGEEGAETGEPLAVVSNRSSRMDQVEWIAGREEGSESGSGGVKIGTGKTVGLSNTVFDDRSWPKILDGEKMVEDEIDEHAKSAESEEELIQRLLGVLSTNSLPQLGDDATAEDYLPYFRRSIFIPLIGTREKKNSASTPAAAGETPAPETKKSSCAEGHKHGTTNGTANTDNDILDQSYLHGPYGTQKQTIILVSNDGRVRYFERTLYDGEARPVPLGEGDRSFEFQVTR